MSSSITLNHPQESGTEAGRTARRRPGPKLFAILAAVALLVVGFFVVKAVTGNDDGGKLTGSGNANFSLAYPNGWSTVSKSDLNAKPGGPIAGVRRDDGAGFVFVREKGRAPKNFGAFSTELTRELDKLVPDFQKRSARVIKIAGGQAFFFSYVRKRKGTVHTVVVAPAGKRSYALDTVSQGGREDVAREIAAMILSFKAQSK
jgi:hypothetical protein